MTDRLVTHSSGLYCRPFAKPLTGDDYIIRERKVYTNLRPEAGDVFLDIGANIGAVTALIAPHVSRVVSVEPEPDNFRVLERNAESLPNVELIRAAVTASGDPIKLYVNDLGANKGSHTTRPVRGRRALEVPGIAFDALLERVRPTLLKIDIEGGEYDFMESLFALPKNVRALAIEMHRTLVAWKSLPAVIDAALLEQGFTRVVPPRLNTDAWAVTGVYHR